MTRINRMGLARTVDSTGGTLRTFATAGASGGAPDRAALGLVLWIAAGLVAAPMAAAQRLFVPPPPASAAPAVEPARPSTTMPLLMPAVAPPSSAAHASVASERYDSMSAEERKREARKHQEESMKLFEIGNYDRSIQELELAYALKRDPRMLYNLGLTYLKRFEVKGNREDLVQARQNFTRFEALVSPDDPAYEKSKDQVIQMRKLTKDYLVNIERELAKPVPKPIPLAVGTYPWAPPPPERPRDWTPIVLYGVAGAAAVTAVVTGVMSLNAQSEARDFKASGAPLQANEEIDRADGLALTTDIMIGVAVVAAGSGLWWQLTHRPPPAEKERLPGTGGAGSATTVSWSLAPRGAGLTVKF
jgi:tetratricopeptide (TPR) repeat protein